MDGSRNVACMLVVAVAIAVFFGAASPCCGAESQGQECGPTFVTLGLALGVLDLGPRAGLEYRWPAGPGVEAAIGISAIPLFVGQFIITGEALAVLPLFRFGRSGTFDLALGVPSLMWGGKLDPGIITSVGGVARLRFELGSRWSLLVRAGAGCLFTLDTVGSHVGALNGTYLWPDLGICSAFRL